MRLLRNGAFLGLAAAFLAMPLTASAQLVITNVFDGPLTGGVPKGVEMCVVNTITDMSLYGIGSANNGLGSNGEEYTFPNVSFPAGTYIYVASDSAGFASFFGFNPDFITGAMSINGDDAIEVFCGGQVIDLFGDINVDGTGQCWDHLDGWASRNSGNGPNPIFNCADWTFSGINALDGETSNATAASPVPIGTYHGAVPVEPVTWGQIKNLGKVSE